MIRWMVATLRRRREKQRFAGKAWAQRVIARDGVVALKVRLEEDQAMGWGRRAFDEGAVEALHEAQAPP